MKFLQRELLILDVLGEPCLLDDGWCWEKGVSCSSGSVSGSDL